MARGAGDSDASGAASDDEDFVADAAASDEDEDDDFKPETKKAARGKAQRGAAQSAPSKRKRKAAVEAAPPAVAKRPMAAFFGGAAAKRETVGAGGSGAAGATEQAACPVCSRSMPLSAVNAHLDACLSRGGGNAGATAAPAATPRAAALPFAVAAQRTPPPARAAVFAPSPLQHGATFDAADVASPLASQATPGGGASLLAPLAADEPLTWPTPELRFRIAGRRFHRQAGAAPAGAAATLRREPSNAADANAILVAPPTSLADAPAYGHVPACIAEHLAPLLDRGWLRVECALPDGAAAGAEASSGDAPAVVARGFANMALPPRAGAALRAGWAAALAAAAAANDAGGRLAAQRRSFCLVAQTVLRRDAPLFPRRHAPMLAAAAALDADAQTLLLQMYTRKGPWFRIATLQYADVPDADAAVDALCAAGLARAMPAPADGENDDSGVDSGAESEDEEADRRSRYSVLTAPELRAAAASAGCASAGGRRDDALAALVRAAPARAEAAWTSAAKRCVRLRACARASLRRAFLLFFLAPGADVARFLLVDLGAVRYPRYGLRDADRDDVACRVFPSRAAVDAFDAASRRRDALHAALEATDTAAAARLVTEAATALRIDAAALRSLAGEPQDAGAAAAEQIVIAGDEGADAEAPAFAPQFARFRPAHLHASVCGEGVALLERARRYADAVALLRALLALRPAPRPTHRGSWWLRLCTDLEHLGRADCALAAAESGLEDAACGPADVAALRAKVLRLAVPPRRWKAPTWAAAAAAETAAHAPRVVRLRAPPALRSVSGRKSLFAAPSATAMSDIDADATALHAALPADAAAPAAAAAAAALALADADAAALPAIAENDDGDAAPAAPDAVTVEALALLHYAAQGWRGSHAESGVWLTLFGLLFWPIIFPADMAQPLGAPRGVFQSAFQTAPLDFGTAAFAEARRDALSARLARIAAGDAPRLIAATWAAHRGAAAAGVSWRAHTLEELQAICEGVRAMPLAALMRLLASDYAGWRAGLPDLVLWRGAPGSREAMLVEVKGTRDSMRPGQRAWATALGAAGIRMEILQYE